MVYLVMSLSTSEQGGLGDTGEDCCIVTGDKERCDEFHKRVENLFEKVTCKEN